MLLLTDIKQENPPNKPILKNNLNKKDNTNATTKHN